MGLADHSLLTFDVVGTCIDFETGIVDSVRRLAAGTDSAAESAAVLEAFARAEECQQQQTPHLPFTQMLEPIYEGSAAARWASAARLNYRPGRLTTSEHACVQLYLRR